MAARTRIAPVISDAEILACFPPMKELRPHLKSARAFVAQVRRQEKEGFRMLAVWRGRKALACAGYRMGEMLARGMYLYVDDLVTLESERSRGHGEKLLKTMMTIARKAGCETFTLDSGTQRTGAHRFYFRHGLVAAAFHFSMKLNRK